MKKKIIIALFVFVSTEVFSLNILQTDTTYQNFTVVQADSLIQANIGNSDFIIIDVRQASSYNSGHIDNAINIDFFDPNFSAILDTLNHNKCYLIYCQSGSRSAQTYNMMIQKHFVEFYNMLGGINAWLSAGYPIVVTTNILLNENTSAHFEIFPNPASGNINVQCNDNGVLYIYNSTGMLVQSVLILDEMHSCFSIANLPKGIYLTLFKNSEDNQQTQIFIFQ